MIVVGLQASKDVQKQITSQTLLTKISSLAEDMPRLGDNPKHEPRTSQVGLTQYQTVFVSVSC